MTTEHEFKITVGKMVVLVRGAGDVFTTIASELSVLPKSDLRPDVEFSISSTPTKRPYSDEDTSLHYNFDAGGFSCSLSKRNKTISLHCQTHPIKPVSSVRSRLRRFRNWNYLLPAENLAKNFMYNIFDWAVQLKQLELGQTWVHASAVERNGIAHLFLARGGVGKTTALLQLCQRQNFHYLSDDLLAIDTDGFAYRSPKKMQIYSYNTIGEPEIRDLLLKKRPLADRLSFAFHEKRGGPKRVRRRVSAEELFSSESVATSAKIGSSIFLERKPTPGIDVSRAEVSNIARRMAPIVMDEIEPYTKIERLARADTIDFLPLSQDLEQEAAKVIESSFFGATSFLVRLGPECGPKDLLRAVHPILEGE